MRKQLSRHGPSGSCTASSAKCCLCFSIFSIFGCLLLQQFVSSHQRGCNDLCSYSKNIVGFISMVKEVFQL
jgi:hypothetical protein